MYIYKCRYVLQKMVLSCDSIMPNRKLLSKERMFLNIPLTDQYRAEWSECRLSWEVSNGVNLSRAKRGRSLCCLLYLILRKNWKVEMLVPFQHTKLWSLVLTTTLYPKMVSEVQRTHCAAFARRLFSTRCKERQKCRDAKSLQRHVVLRDKLRLSEISFILHPDERNT